MLVDLVQGGLIPASSTESMGAFWNFLVFVTSVVWWAVRPPPICTQLLFAAFRNSPPTRVECAEFPPRAPVSLLHAEPCIQ